MKQSFALGIYLAGAEWIFWLTMLLNHEGTSRMETKGIFHAAQMTIMHLQHLVCS